MDNKLTPDYDGLDFTIECMKTLVNPNVVSVLIELSDMLAVFLHQRDKLIASFGRNPDYAKITWIAVIHSKISEYAINTGKSDDDIIPIVISHLMGLNLIAIEKAIYAK